SDVRVIYHKGRPQAALLKEFRADVSARRRGMALLPVLEEVLVPLGRSLDTIQRANYYRDGNAEVQARVRQINRLFIWLGHVENCEWSPPAIAHLRRHNDEPMALERFFADLERLAAFMMLVRPDPVARAKRYKEVLDEMHRRADLAREGSPLQLTPTECAEMLR